MEQFDGRPRNLVGCYRCYERPIQLWSRSSAPLSVVEVVPNALSTQSSKRQSVLDGGDFTQTNTRRANWITVGSGPWDVRDEIARHPQGLTMHVCCNHCTRPDYGAHNVVLRVVVRRMSRKRAPRRSGIRLPAAVPEILQATRLSGLNSVEAASVLGRMSTVLRKQQSVMPERTHDAHHSVP